MAGAIDKRFLRSLDRDASKYDKMRLRANKRNNVSSDPVEYDPITEDDSSATGRLLELISDIESSDDPNSVVREGEMDSGLVNDGKPLDLVKLPEIASPQMAQIANLSNRFDPKVMEAIRKKQALQMLMQKVQ